MSDHDESVTLRFPAATERVRLARTLVASVADDAGFDYDEVEDLRIAVDELCFVLLDLCSASGHIELMARHSPGRVEVEGRCGMSSPASSDQPPTSELSAQILATVVDTYDISVDGDGAQFRFTKIRP